MSDKKQVSRREFLNYSLTGLGGFMAAGMLMPMLRFAVDPVLQHATSSSDEFTNVGLSINDINEEPQRVDWKINQVDAWYEAEVNQTAWVFKNENGDIQAFSPKCKHLGCFVSWDSDPRFENEFYCPCHDGRYYKDGRNVPGTPPLAPLDVYDQKIEKDMLFLGHPRERGEA